MVFARTGEHASLVLFGVTRDGAALTAKAHLVRVALESGAVLEAQLQRGHSAGFALFERDPSGITVRVPHALEPVTVGEEAVLAQIFSPLTLEILGDSHG